MPQKRHRPILDDTDEVLSEGRARPYGMLASVSWLLERFSPPSESFNAAAHWVLTYALWLENAKRAAGYMELRRERSGSGLSLQVESAVLQKTGVIHSTKAKILCADDALCTPHSWQLESSILSLAGDPVPSTQLTYTAVVKKNTIEAEFSAGKRFRQLLLPFTSNWSLFEAVQRLSTGRTTSPLRFALLEDLDLLKPRQTLSALGTTSVAVAGGRFLSLDGYEQIGDGVLPCHYWVDDQHRLLFAISGTRAYLYDPDARQGLRANTSHRKEI